MTYWKIWDRQARRCVARVFDEDTAQSIVQTMNSQLIKPRFKLRPYQFRLRLVSR